MSFQSDTSAALIAGAMITDTAVKAALGALVGTYGLIKQFDLNERQIQVAERAATRADEYLALAQDAYANITKPAFSADLTLFNRFVSQFGGYQGLYAYEAFRLTTYTQDYLVQEGRALSAVQRQFDKAALQRKRQAGKYNTGRAVYEAVWFASMTALAKVDAVNQSYRFEEARKRYYESWYWTRQTQGAHVIQQMEADAINALGKGQAGVAAGLSSIGQAEGNMLKAAENVEATLANRADIWGGLANGAFKVAGFGLSQHQTSGMNFLDGGGSHEPLNVVPFGFGSAFPNT